MFFNRLTRFEFRTTNLFSALKAFRIGAIGLDCGTDFRHQPLSSNYVIRRRDGAPIFFAAIELPNAGERSGKHDSFVIITADSTGGWWAWLNVRVGHGLLGFQRL